MYSYDRRQTFQAFRDTINAVDKHNKNVAKIQTVRWNEVPPETLEKILAILRRDLVGF